MNQFTIDKLAKLNKYQIAGLAMFGSTTAALAVALSLRHFGFISGRRADEAVDAPAQPAVSTSSASDVPAHFSEDLIVPGLTHTGPEIVLQDNADGRSSEGV